MTARCVPAHTHADDDRNDAAGASPRAVDMAALADSAALRDDDMPISIHIDCVRVCVMMRRLGFV